MLANTITIKVSSLYNLVEKIKDDGMDFVEVSILDEQEMDDGEIIPAALSLSATSENQLMSIDYECESSQN